MYDAFMQSKYIVGSLIGLLVAKFYWPLFAFDVPLGYDPGIYRYLFLQYADALGSLSMPVLPAWAGEHPPGLFVLGAVLMKMGLSPDALIGWVWNAIPVLLACVLAWVTSARKGNAVGIIVLGCALISQAYFDGFFAMYWKVYAALIFVCLTFHFAEKFSPWFLLTALITVTIHHQTGLIMVMSLGTWWLLQLRSQWKNPLYRTYTVGICIIAVLGFLVYLPHFERMFWSPLKSIFLLRGDDAPAGAFPDLQFYLTTMFVLFSFGVIGFIRSLRTERGTLWQLAVVSCAIFIIFQLVFYKRFFLHLDFFLLPFAAEAVFWLWNRYTQNLQRALIVAIVGVQTIVSTQTMLIREPRISSEQFAMIHTIKNVAPKGATVLTLDNVTAPWLLGWMPLHRIGAPGLFDYPKKTYEDWENFVFGSPADRREFLSSIDGDIYLYTSPVFFMHYGEQAQVIVADPCLEQLGELPLFHFTCTP